MAKAAFRKGKKPLGDAKPRRMGPKDGPRKPLKWAKYVDGLAPTEEERDDGLAGEDADSVASHDLQLLSDLLDAKPTAKKSKKQPTVMFKEAYDEGQFNISSAEAATGAVTVDRLLGALEAEDSGVVVQARRKLKKLSRAGAQTLGLEKPKSEREAEERAAVRGLVRSDMREWVPAVNTLEKRPTVAFPLHVPEPPSQKSLQALVTDMEGETPLEQRVRETLEAAGIRTRIQRDAEDRVTDIVALDQDEQDLLGPEATKSRQDKLAKLKAVMGYKQKKLAWIKSIKSKTYRKIMRKSKVSKEEKALQRLEEIDPQAAIAKRRAKMEMDRARERATLKHKNSAAATRRRRNLMKWSKAAREDMHNAQNLAEKLTKRFQEPMDAQLDQETSDSEEEGEGQKDEVTAEEAKQAADASAIIQSLRMGVDQDCPAKVSHGVAALPFMRRAYQKQREELLQEIDALEKEFHEAQKGDTVDAVKMQKALLARQHIERVEAHSDAGSEHSDRDEYGFLTPKGIERREKQRKSEARAELRRIREADEAARKSATATPQPAPSPPFSALDSRPQATAESSAPKSSAKPTTPKSVATQFLDDLEADQDAGDRHAEARRQTPLGVRQPPRPSKPPRSAPSAPAAGPEAGPAEPSAPPRPKAKRAKKRPAAAAGEEAGSADLPERAEPSAPPPRRRQKKGGAAAEKPRGLTSMAVLNGTAEAAADPGAAQLPSVELDEGEGSEGEGALIHPSLLEDQEYLVGRAFAEDNVDADFMLEKEELLAKDVPGLNEAAVLPGWGEWGGADPKLNKRREARLKELREERRQKVEELRAKRPDGGLDHVILNDNVGVVPQMFCLRKVPRLYDSEEAFAHSLKHPLGPDTNTELATQTLLRPKVRTARGRVIQPLTKDSLPPKKTQQTKLRKADARPRPSPKPAGPA